MQRDVPPGIRYDNVSRFFAEHVSGGDVPLTFELISGGRSNLTYKVTGGGSVWVLRRPPLGHVLPTAHDMAREFRVLSGLDGTNVPAPHPFALCEDPAVNDYPFYVMDYREGEILVETIPEGFALRPEDRRAISIALIDTLARLHAVDWRARGLGDFAHKPEAYLERQVRRWAEQWERSKTRELPDIEEVIRRLRLALPESPPPTIVHGDYRLGNIMIDRDDPGRITAVLDWEMATIGDPLSDLAWTLIYWGEAGDSEERLQGRSMARLTTAPGFLTRDELVAEYARRSGRNIDHVDFYVALAYYKLAVITEGIYARYLQGKTVGEGFDGMAHSAEGLIEQAMAATSASPDPRLRGEA